MRPNCIVAQFCVCMFLDFREKALNMLKLCRNDQRKRKNKKEQTQRPCCGIRLQFTKYTVYLRNGLS